MICGWNRKVSSAVLPPPPTLMCSRWRQDGLLNLSFNGENQVVETGFSSNRIPDGWSRSPLFCPSNLLRLPNRKVTHGGGCMGWGEVRGGTVCDARLTLHRL